MIAQGRSLGGLILILFAVITVGLGIADLIVSRVAYCQSDTYLTSCSPTPGENYSNVLIFTWISAGIWGGALVRVADSSQRILHHVVTKAQQVLRQTTVTKQS